MSPQTQALLVRDASGGRQYEAGDFPLRVGSGEAADIRLPGLTSGETLAFLGMEAGELFVQPAREGIPLLLNEKPVTESLWLRDGDILRLENVRLHFEITEARLALRVESVAGETATEQAVVVPPPRPAESIEAVAFEPGHGATPPSAPRVRPLTLAMWAAFALLALLVAFLFSARSVRIVIEPEPEHAEVSGILPVEIGGRYLLLSGSHRVQAEKPEYRKLDAEIQVGPEQNQEIVLRLERLPGILEVTTGNVQGAQVFVDGEPRAQTPGELEIPEGVHELGVVKERYLPYSESVTIQGGGARQALVVELVPGWADVGIASQPPGAGIFIDGEAAGVTPGPVEVMAGSHRLELRLAGHKTWRRQLEVRANRHQTLAPVSLEIADAVLELASEPEAAQVLVDGTYRGETPISLDLAPGAPHEIRVSRAGHRPATESVTLASGETQQSTLRLPVRRGEVRITAQPPGARLFVDGRERGDANQAVRLSARPHDLEVRHEGYQPFRTRIRPEPGFPLALSVALVEVGAEPEAAEAGLATPEGQELILVTPGRFRMGSSRREQGRRANEALRTVELTRPFLISAREVSNKDFDAFDPSHASGSLDSEDLDAPQLPVVNVTWEQAAAYCNWLSERESLPPVYQKQGDTWVARDPVPNGYRLPTEAEWEWMARFAGGEAAQKYPWGMALPPTPRSGNYADTAARDLTPSHLPEYLDGFAASAPVASFAPNELGIYDLGGNVAEWSHDPYSIAPGSGGSVETDPTGPASGRHHVIRGSSWKDSSITRLRLSFRDYGDSARPDVGFRIARYAD